MERRHEIRLAILTALSGGRMAPLTLDRLVLCLDVEAAGVSRQELLAELPGLMAHGYVRNLLEARGGWLLQITGSGLDQLRRDADMDDYIYGDAAYMGRAPDA